MKRNKDSLKGIVIVSIIIIFTLIAAAVLYLKDDNKKAAETSADTSSVAQIIKASEPSSDVSSTIDTSETPSEPKPEVKKFEVTSLKSTETTTNESTVLLSGTSDINTPLMLNFKNVERDENGVFAINQDLKIGKNVFTFKYGEETYNYTVTYKYIVVKSYSPKAKQTLSSGSTFSVNVNARAGSTVTAAFNGKTITLKKDIKYAAEQSESDFADFIGSFTLPNDNMTDKNLGIVKIKATYNGSTEIYSSKDIICKKNSNIKYIAEVVAYSAETFNGSTSDDNSSPLNNYLPKGTVDYCDEGLVYYNKGTSSERSYYKMRCGRRVYVNNSKNDSVITKRYTGTLPDHNELEVLSVNQKDHHTYLTLKTLFKAPFLLQVLPQKYNNEAYQNYTFSAATYEYIEITFCYATKFTGEIDLSGSTVFNRATVTTSGGKTVLRLYLAKKGQFYGWSSRYDNDGNLVFSFLEPYKTVSTDANEYGIDLTGAQILVDAGHGGTESGSYGVAGFEHYEKYHNLILANLVKEELEKLGATVIMTRTSDTTVSADERCKLLFDTEPDYCISIHHDGNAKSAELNGFGAYHSTPFSYNATRFVRDRMDATDIFQKKTTIKWHYFFLARMSSCPVVLTENGYMTNSYDYFSTINNTEMNKKKAKAIVLGITDYFKSIQ